MINISQIEAIRQRVLEIIPEGAPLEQTCLYHAMAACNVLGPACKLVAGSAHWRITYNDTGSNPLFFSYEFTPGFTLEGSMMPEMHVWNTYKGKVLDLTTKYTPIQCKNMLGVDFDLTLPEYLYAKADDKKKERWAYYEKPAATQMANQMVMLALAEHEGRVVYV